MVSIEEAFELLAKHIEPLATTTVALSNSVGRVLFHDVKADVNSPPHDKSVMDGFAVRSADVAAGLMRLEVVETIIAGQVPKSKLEPGQSAQIMTGAPIPEGADAVVMVEQTETEQAEGKRWVELKVDSVEPEKHVLRKGVNFTVGQTVFAKGHVVRPTDIGLLAEVGSHQVTVSGKPTVGVIPTGDELVDCVEIPSQGQIRNSNGPMLLAMAQSLNLETVDIGVGRDDPEKLRELIKLGLENDLLLLSGGVSAGTKDLVPGILNELGVKQVFHKVLVKPGKPIWFGVLNSDDKRTYVFGLPGNPVSSLVGFQLFARAAVRKMMGSSLEDSGSSLENYPSSMKLAETDPRIGPEKLCRTIPQSESSQPLVWRGSSDLFALGGSERSHLFSRRWQALGSWRASSISPLRVSVSQHQAKFV